MSSAPDLSMSRPLGVAAEMCGTPIDTSLLSTRPVLLTGEASTLATLNGRWCFLNCLRLLPRVFPNVTVNLPDVDADFAEQVHVLTRSLYRQGSLRVTSEPIDPTEFDSVLNVGCGSQRDVPWTSVNSNGWVVRASSDGTGLEPDTTQANPVAALMAASLGVAEVFKRVFRIPDGKAPRLSATCFSLFTLSSSNDPGPPIPKHLMWPHTVVVGAGAIGNGIVLLMSQLGAGGRVHIVDKQDFGVENFGTCVLLDDPEWLAHSKADSLANWLGAQSPVVVTAEAAAIAYARAGQVISEMQPQLVLNGLDDIDARRDAQLLWPSVLVDGGINAVGAAVVTHRLDRPGAGCLRCTFKRPSIDAMTVQHSATGLAEESLADLGGPLTERDVELADPTHQPWLREMLAQGKTRCAVVSAGVSERLGVALAESFRPSVPFVATAAASLVVGEAVKALYFPDARYTHRFQIESFFRGFETAVGVLQPASHECICTTQRSIIEDLVKTRSKQRAMPECTSEEPIL